MTRTIELRTKLNQPQRLALMSDVHFDNPKCDRAKLRADLEEIERQDMRILLNGDLFCAMEGRNDPRRSRNILPAHNRPAYFDALVDDAAAFWQPYAHRIDLIGYGNHETSVLKNNGTDLLARFAAAVGRSQTLGGYGGWMRVRLRYSAGNRAKTYRIKYFHGSGGGGPVTKGLIAHQRMMAQVHGADCIWMGHVHESYVVSWPCERITERGTVHLAEVLHVRSATYKEEYGDGSKGWHVERGAPPKPLGCHVLELRLKGDQIQANAYPLRY